MKKLAYWKYCLIIISLMLVSVHIQAQNGWTLRTHVPSFRACGTASVVDEKIYFIGGLYPGLVDADDNEMYDPVTNTWDTTLSPMPTPRGFLASAVVNGIIYVIGGGYPVATTKNEAYNPITDTWTPKADIPGGPRLVMSAAVVNGIIYVEGGNYYENYFCAYDPVTDTWDSTLAPMPMGGGISSLTAYNGLIYTFGGSGSSWVPFDYLYAYNPQTNTWDTTLTPMPTARHSLYTYLVGDTIYAVGGSQSYGTALTTVEAYHPITDSWESLPDMPNPYCMFAGAEVNNKIYVIGGTSDWVISDYTIWENDSIWIIPVELTSFTATTNGKKVTLNWSTSTELNNLGFEIQRSTEGIEFITVGFVNGNGTTTEPQTYSYADKNLDNGKYYYRLKQVDYNGSYEYSDVVEVDFRAFISFLLEQNYPNPFNPSTTIGFGLQEKCNIKITIMNSIGEEVAVLLNEEMDSGYHTVEFNASNLPSGVYFYQLRAGDYINTKKMLLLK
jgi:N-acetylneuraminic acid mutarotase